MRLDFRAQYVGRWAGVLSFVGFPEQLLNGQHHVCPFCVDKKWRRFRWDRKREFSICNYCGAFQPIELAIRWTGYTFKELIKLIRNERIETMEKIKPIDDAKILAQNESRIKKIHAGMKRITPDTSAGLYLIKRGITEYPPYNCYAHDGIPYYQDGKVIAEYPAMVSVIRNSQDETVTYHITYLTNEGEKAKVECVRKVLPMIKPCMSGAAIKLFKPDTVLAIAEGVETALSFYTENGIPVWSAINTNGMICIDVPEYVKDVYIVCDEDKSFSGQLAAYTLANRLRIKENKNVWVIRLKYNIDELESYSESGLGMDYNDYLCSMTKKEA